MRFKILQTAGLARRGTFRLKNNRVINTPSFLCPTSRGAVPHLTPDNVNKRNEDITGFFVGVEDFMDKLPDESSIPFLHYVGSSIRDLLSLPDSVMVVGPRRSTPIDISHPNSDELLSIMTSEGIKKMQVELYYEFVNKFKPDLVLACPDIPNLSPGGEPGGNRTRKMVIRTERWLDMAFNKLENQDQVDIFAVVLPGVQTIRQQQEYIDYLKQHKDKISGLSVWTKANRLSAKQLRHIHMELGDSRLSIGMVPSELSHLPKFHSMGCETPQEILQLVLHGFDMFQGDCLTQFTDAGVALDFTFPATAGSLFGRNLWNDEYVNDTTSIVKINTNVIGNHHCAYINHLLKAREMTSWVLLQMQNLHVLSEFFKGIRTCIENGTFDREVVKFIQVYGDGDVAQQLRDMHRSKNSGPTARGYSIGFKELNNLSQQGQSDKINDQIFRQL